MRAENTDTVTCPSCGATLVAGLRFCRMCGYRLGEGVEEYVPTQRFDPSSMPKAAPPPPATDPFTQRATWGAGPAPVQPMRPFGATSALNQPGQDASSPAWVKACAPKRGGWWLWIVIGLVIMFAAGILPLSIKLNRARGGQNNPGPPAVSLMAEADAFDTPDGGGAMIRGLAGPGSSLEAAGLVGGDIITNFDGKAVRDAAALRGLIAQTPPGKAVEVVYIHDGETKKTTLTTLGRQDFRGMQPIDTRPGGRGIIGVDPGGRVRLPNSNLYGVELDDVDRNGPADLAGLKEGDVVFEFGGKPIRTPGDLRLRIYESIPGSTVTVSVMRDGQRLDIPVKIGRQRD
ncbi:MAG TPA: PDZ domain-containing protein [Pyrinomonadaceae bacterium]|nr:PDZ domain-containing protein [Pyrinomonadaceae bacterium]